MQLHKFAMHIQGITIQSKLCILGNAEVCQPDLKYTCSNCYIFYPESSMNGNKQHQENLNALNKENVSHSLS